MDVTNTNANGAYIKVKGVDFGSAGAASLSVRVASSGSGKLTASLGSKTGTVIATCAVAATGGAQKWATVSCPVTGAKGKNDLYWTFSGSFGFAWWQFTAGNATAVARSFEA